MKRCVNSVKVKGKVTMINVIACVTRVRNRLAIGRRGDLLFRLKDDMDFFKTTTTTTHRHESSLHKNVLLMGRKTWESIPAHRRPLPDRIQLILTTNTDLLQSSPLSDDLDLTPRDFYFITLDTFVRIYERYMPQVFVIGGAEIYRMFMNERVALPDGTKLQVHTVYLTHVQSDEFTEIRFDKDDPDTFMDEPKEDYTLVSYSEKYQGEYKQGWRTTQLSYRIVTYQGRTKTSV